MNNFGKILWIVSEERGGIRAYADALVPGFGGGVDAVYSLDQAMAYSELPKLIHIQHEFGLFGSKLPGLNTFETFLKALKGRFPNVPIIGTAHTVLDETFRYQTTNRGIVAIPRAIANFCLIPLFRKFWNQGTWGSLDGVIVHSRLQANSLSRMGIKNVEVIPHFVPKADASRLPSQAKLSTEKEVLLFGYFSHEKGQSLAIEAWRLLGNDSPNLTLAGGARKKSDQRYLDYCISLIRKFKLQNKITLVGYLPTEELDAFYKKADLIIAPFTETNGSGSLAQALGRSAPILTSDLPLNTELVQRVPGSVAYFKAGDAADLALQLGKLIVDRDKLLDLSKSASKYANHYSRDQTVKFHRKFYEKILSNSR